MQRKRPSLYEGWLASAKAHADRKCLTTEKWRPSAAEVAAVKALFAVLRKHLDRVIRKNHGYAPKLLFGTVGAAGWMTNPSEQAAMDAIVASCAPLHVQHGMQLPSNAFHAYWAELCDWAIGEGLLLELRQREDATVVRTEYELVAHPISGWLTWQ